MSHLRPSVQRWGSRSGGFALSEFILVILLVTGLLIVITVSVGNIRDETSQSNCQSDLRTLKLATAQYLAQNDRYPESKTELVQSGLAESEQIDRWDIEGGGSTARPEYVAVEDECDPVAS